MLRRRFHFAAKLPSEFRSSRVAGAIPFLKTDISPLPYLPVSSKAAGISLVTQQNCGMIQAERWEEAEEEHIKRRA